MPPSKVNSNNMKHEITILNVQLRKCYDKVDPIGIWFILANQVTKVLINLSSRPLQVMSPSY